MKIAVALLIVISAFIDPTKISTINTIKSEAKKVFNEGKYKEAIKKYRYLIDTLNVNEDEVKINLASAYYLSNDTANAKTTYQGLTQSENTKIRSKAFQQLGNMYSKTGKTDEALSQFKQAIKSDPANQDARYNYEMLKKKLEEQKKKDEQKNKDNKDQEPSEFAKKLKAQADKLVAAKEYKSAYDLMMNGLSKDKTVSHYQKYIEHIKDVVEIIK